MTARTTDRKAERSTSHWPLATVAGLAICALVVYGLFDPATSPLFPKCPLRWLTGYDCPGCGSQRAIHALLHADVGAAWRYNALALLSLPFLALLVASRHLALRGNSLAARIYPAITSPTACYIIASVVVGWWVLRNIF